MGTTADMNVLARKSTQLHALTEEEKAQLKKALLEMLQDLMRVFEKHHITYMLGFGSCLGAVRHGGFIPWDDDLDLLVLRKDLPKFFTIFERELGDKYEFTAPNTGKESKNNFTKIYKKGTLFLEISDTQTSFPKGIYIDIFPLDYAPENKFLRWIKGAFCNLLCQIAVSVFYAQYPSPEMALFMSQSRKTKSAFFIRKMFGKRLSVIPHRTWCNWADKMMSGRKSHLMTIACGRYFNNVLSKDIYLPGKKGLFEGVEVVLPQQPEIYLSSIYGKDYMQVPPPEKRERHFVIAFDAATERL